MIRVGIFVKENDYGHALARGIGRRYMPFRIDILSSYIAGDCDNTYDIFLTDFDIKGHCVIKLVDNISEERLDKNNEYAIFKYKKIEDLVKDIILVYFYLTGITLRVLGNKEAKVIAFANLDIDLSTRLSLTCVSEFIEKKTLYVSFRVINTSLFYQNISYHCKILMMLYYIKNNKDFPIENFITSGELGIDILGDKSILNTLSQCSNDEVNLIIEKIKMLQKYDYIFVDLGDRCLELISSLEKYVDAMVLIGSKNIEEKNYYDDMLNMICRFFNKHSLILYQPSFANIEEDNDNICEIKNLSNLAQDINNISKEILGKDVGRDACE